MCILLIIGLKSLNLSMREIDWAVFRGNQLDSFAVHPLIWSWKYSTISYWDCRELVNPTFSDTPTDQCWSYIPYPIIYIYIYVHILHNCHHDIPKARCGRWVEVQTPDLHMAGWGQLTHWTARSDVRFVCVKINIYSLW